MSCQTSVYEQMVLELLENGEKELVRELLRTIEPLVRLKFDHPDRYMKLESFCKQPYFNPSEAYEMGSSRETRRNEIAQELAAEVSSVEPSRLLALLGQSMKYQQSIGLLAPGISFDLFHGHKKTSKRDNEDNVVRKELEIFRGMKERLIQCLCFAPDGQSFVLAGQEGFIEVWDTESLKIRQDLDYQQQGKYLNQGSSVLCGSFSKDGDHLAVGSSNGQVKIWRLSSGQAVKVFPQAHRDGVLAISFAKDGLQLLTASFDATARIHGLKSGKTLKEFRGHSSFVNTAIYTRDNSQVITGSADGMVKIWDSKTTECLHSLR
jgi:WD40 repeat-containing protein SMU1